jgi:hypothetical protein
MSRSALTPSGLRRAISSEWAHAALVHTLLYFAYEAGRPAALSARTIAARATHVDRKIRRERPLRWWCVFGIIRVSMLGLCYIESVS